MLAHVTSERSPKWASQNLVKYKDCLQMLEVLSFLSYFFYGVDTNWPLPPSHQSYNQAKAEDLDAGKKQQELMIYPQHKVQGFSRKGWFPRKSGTSFCLPFLAGEVWRQGAAGEVSATKFKGDSFGQSCDDGPEFRRFGTWGSWGYTWI